MDAWIPLIKELIWPVFWAVLLLVGRKPIARLLKAVEERIVAGAEFEAGATGIKVGAAPKLAEVTSVSASSVLIKTESGSGGGSAEVEEGRETVPTPRSFYLVLTRFGSRAIVLPLLKFGPLSGVNLM